MKIPKPNVDSSGSCRHCGRDPAIFYGKESPCDHIHFPENCKTCILIANDIKKQAEIALKINMEKGFDVWI